MHWYEQLSAFVLTLLGGGVLGSVAVKFLNRPVDQATAAQINANAKREAKEAAKTEVETIRTVLQEVRAHYQGEIANIKARLTGVEERERSMLTQWALHQAWDISAMEILTRINPNHPTPPPLVVEVIKEVKVDELDDNQ